jgi:hypothetical protein
LLNFTLFMFWLALQVLYKFTIRLIDCWTSAVNILCMFRTITSSIINKLAFIIGYNAHSRFRNLQKVHKVWYSPNTTPTMVNGQVLCIINWQPLNTPPRDVMGSSVVRAQGTVTTNIRKMMITLTLT